MIVEDGDSFPNGATSPDDSHRFCRCTATTLSVPDSLSSDDLAALGLDTLLALYTIGSIAARHDRDMAAQQQQQQQSDDDENDEDEGD